MKSGTAALVELISQNTLVLGAEFAAKEPQPVNHKRLCDLLQQEVKGGYAVLIVELDEANKAFHGNDGILTTVLRVGCLQFVANALKAYRAEQLAQEVA